MLKIEDSNCESVPLDEWIKGFDPEVMAEAEIYLALNLEIGPEKRLYLGRLKHPELAGDASGYLARLVSFSMNYGFFSSDGVSMQNQESMVGAVSERLTIDGRFPSLSGFVDRESIANALDEGRCEYRISEKRAERLFRELGMCLAPRISLLAENFGRLELARDNRFVVEPGKVHIDDSRKGYVDLMEGAGIWLPQEHVKLEDAYCIDFCAIGD